MKTLSADMAALCRQIRGEAQVAIALHENPDHDAAGAAVGLRELFVQLGVPAEIHLSPHEHLPSHTFFLDEALLDRGVPPSGATLYVLDAGSLARTALAVESWKGTVVNVDHHHDNTRFGDVVYVRGDASSTAEIICDVFAALDEVPSPAAAAALYAGISFDSGHFRHSSTSAHTLRQAAWLVACGADPAAVYRELYERRSLDALRLWARAVANTTIVGDGRALVSLLTVADYAAAGAGEDDTEAIVDSLRSIDGVQVAVLVKEQTSGARVRVSLRSQGWDVSALAAERGGGGHQRAAGFSADDDPQEVVEWLSSVLGARLRTASS
jgi:bifunctional oligoribonuclease and PAP phosphatase NrnA